ncbi:predicted protein [Sclerotinia sclerotiorum 1980 UF-70]|uniref:Uncharacterized protein n=1 Tax=Sclerotinia sclerotiorum (strain ATCC 18683 / 1980 / Ss-1) TaxID=665079 RepID=A7E603_SCLS1|nr:predicted protein [Sclerotinia sclerotiorum 1980 UF-70]EDN91325.1 predicted protein [Sclerotinia sclerotiorum 1980 UF-70]
MFWRCRDRMLKMLLMMKKSIYIDNNDILYIRISLSVDIVFGEYSSQTSVSIPRSRNIGLSSDGIRGEWKTGAELTGYFRPTLSQRYSMRSEIAVGSGGEIGAIGNPGACKNLLKSTTKSYSRSSIAVSDIATFSLGVSSNTIKSSKFRCSYRNVRFFLQKFQVITKRAEKRNYI